MNRQALDGAPQGEQPDALDQSQPIAVEHYDTQSVPSHLRHAAWSARGWPSVAALFESRAIGEFSTTADRVDFDGLTVQFAYGTARHFDRSAEKAREDGIDILGIGVHFDGAFVGATRGRPFHAPAGALLLLDMAQPSVIELPEGRSVQLGMPRRVADEQFGQVSELHGTVVDPERASTIVRHLMTLRDALPRLAEHQLPRLGRTVIDMLAITLNAQPRKQRRNARDDLDPAVAARREIDARLGAASLTIPSLCKALRVSRSALYRMFEPDGGVEAYIRSQRLDRVREALLDPANKDRVGDLAYRWGFSDASHLTRQFRDKYGMAPGEFRTAARKGTG